MADLSFTARDDFRELLSNSAVEYGVVVAVREARSGLFSEFMVTVNGPSLAVHSYISAMLEESRQSQS